MLKHFLKNRIISCLGLLLVSGWAVAADEPDLSIVDDYKVNAGDIIYVSVWKEEGMEGEVLIRPDGKFSFPLAGDIMAKGQSIEDIRRILTERLSRYIPELVVSVAILQVAGNKVFVIGQVNRPGEILVNPQIDILQALSIAGGTTPFAEVEDIKVLRRTDQGLITIPFSYGDIEKGKNLEQNIMLKAGDVVVVP
ncbi:MAG: polysaccharide biosynthesis/export family protein [Gammaproteobacteria bacterium]|jgi:polysaccharide export outer membrane protein|nr:polysaccharide biosynthesis/export family protein [Gammaproteobacteria bacterium]MDP6615773.1 polysaccharide biosynthesis/export family protein [Gammaproteobacteria bacterium]MDP6695541.1 polysaccharide biosynthesis/export family protein [Gammaproteobacteria bacterium]